MDPSPDLLDASESAGALTDADLQSFIEGFLGASVGLEPFGELPPTAARTPEERAWGILAATARQVERSLHAPIPTNGDLRAVLWDGKEVTHRLFVPDARQIDAERLIGGVSRLLRLRREQVAGQLLQRLNGSLAALTLGADAAPGDSLRLLAGILGALPSVQAAWIGVFEASGVLATATDGLDQLQAKRPLELMMRLHSWLQPRAAFGEWTPIPRDAIPLPSDLPCAALLIPIPQGRVIVALAYRGPAGLRRITEAVIAKGSIPLAANITAAFREQNRQRARQLLNLATKQLQQEEISPREIVAALAAIFAADVATLFLEDGQELRLSASTDRLLGERSPVGYSDGQSLTWRIFSSGRPIRLRNCLDQAEVKAATSLDRIGPTHVEHDLRDVETVQFLGVPLREAANARALGVVRLLRAEGATCFSADDEEALQLFADLVGTRLARAWDLWLADSLRRSTSIAVAVSRREPDGAEGTVPRLVMVNRGATAMLGMAEQDLKGSDARELYTTQSYAAVRAVLEVALDEAEREGRSETNVVDADVRCADGSLKHLSISYHVLANRLVVPRTYYTVGFSRDKTHIEQKVAQHRRLMEMLDEMGLAYFRCDASGATIESGGADCRITGYAQRELDAGLRRSLLYEQPNDREKLIAKARASGGHVVGARQQMKRKDGQLFWAQGDLRVLKDETGNEIGAEGLYRDVTDRLRLQGFVNASTDQVMLDDELFEKLEQNAKFNLDYLSSLGHQLLTPLSSLVETLRSVERGILRGDPGERMRYVIGQARVCTRLVRNLSYMDKVLRGEQFPRSRVSLGKLAVETKLDFLHLLGPNRLSLEVDDAALDRHVPVEGHAEMLRQVIVNLVDNAIKYSLYGSTIRIRGYRHNGGGVFEISNRGLRIPEAHRERVFERGFRSSHAKMQIPYGTGLGLWLVRKIVEAHGATISCAEELLNRGQRWNVFRIVFSTPGEKGGRRG